MDLNQDARRAIVNGHISCIKMCFCDIRVK